MFSYLNTFNYLNTVYFIFSWLARTNPADVARVEKFTFISTERKSDTVPTTCKNVTGELGNWISPADMDKAILERFPGCMKGNFKGILKMYF